MLRCSRGKRTTGMTLTEMLVVMSLSVVVISIVLYIGNVATREIRKISANMEVDEEISKFQLDVKQIVTRSWTGSQDIDVSPNTIEMRTSVPFARDADIYESTYATITHDSTNGHVLFLYYNRSDQLTSDLIAIGVEQCEFSYDGIFLTYDATFSTYSPNLPELRKNIKGSVRFY